MQSMNLIPKTAFVCLVLTAVLVAAAAIQAQPAATAAIPNFTLIFPLNIHLKPLNSSSIFMNKAFFLILTSIIEN